MKHLLRKYEALASEYEAEAYGFYEAKHILLLHVAKPRFIATQLRLHFSYTVRCASFAPQFIQEITKSTPHVRSAF